ncbi:amidohydrolase family protein [Amycolatopsis kentuckyensis]|uniref:amidohydrolase family protein n=1 Tax=Amycolatopsis kentuckyensis TaxID=218823 RepID=UPI00356B46B7
MLTVPLVVDIHAHAHAPVDELVAGREHHVQEQRAQLSVFGPESVAINRTLFRDEWYPALTEPATRLHAMDRAGVDVQAVSVAPTQYHSWADEVLADELTYLVNEHLADLAAKSPDRLTAMAHVAFQHPGRAAGHLRDAVERYGMKSVQIPTRSGEREFDDPALDVFWATAEELGVLVFVHPWGCTVERRLSSYYLGNIIGQPLETTIALCRLVFAGVLDRFPRLRICGAHGGGFLPVHLGRADHAYEVRPESRSMAKRPSEYLSQLYFDSLVYRAPELAALTRAVGADRVLLGTDYPFDMGVSDPLARLEQTGLPTAELRRIAGLNAAGLLGLTQRKEKRT